MKGSGPQTKEWKAVENRMPPGARLKVTGQIETSNSNQTPHLREAASPGLNPTILLLDLTVESSGTGATVMGWKPVEFSKEVRQGQYASVHVRWESDVIQQIEVEAVH